MGTYLLFIGNTRKKLGKKINTFFIFIKIKFYFKMFYSIFKIFLYRNKVEFFSKKQKLNLFRLKYPFYLLDLLKLNE